MLRPGIGVYLRVRPAGCPARLCCNLFIGHASPTRLRRSVLFSSRSDRTIAGIHRSLRAHARWLYRMVHLCYTLPAAIRGLLMLSARSASDPVRIVVGASSRSAPGWIPTEEYTLNLLDERHWRRFFRPGAVDAILAEHVWEHLDDAESVLAARLCFKYLKPGGYLRVAVPDGHHPSSRYLDYVRPGGHGGGADDHQQLYTYKTLEDVFSGVGYEVDLLEYFDEDGVFQSKPWDATEGYVHRSRYNDDRNRGGELRYTSIILDAIKPTGA